MLLHKWSHGAQSVPKKVSIKTLILTYSLLLFTVLKISFHSMDLDVLFDISFWYSYLFE